MLGWRGDGPRYALRVERKALSDEIRSRIPPAAVAVVSVHETLTGAPIFAVPLTTEPAVLLLDADGSRLIVVGEDGRLTRWTLPVEAK